MSLWLNWKEGYIEKVVSYILSRKQVKTSVIAFSLLLTPFILNAFLSLVDRFGYAHLAITLIAPSALTGIIFKELIERRGIENAVRGELIFNYQNISRLITFFNMFRFLEKSDFHKNLKNHWSTEVFDKYIDKIISGDIIESSLAYKLIRLYELMDLAIMKIDMNESPFSNDNFLFDIFLASKDDGLGMLDEMRVLIESTSGNFRD